MFMNEDRTNFRKFMTEEEYWEKEKPPQGFRDLHREFKLNKEAITSKTASHENTGTTAGEEAEEISKRETR